jgi:hypothetical protein
VAAVGRRSGGSSSVKAVVAWGRTDLAVVVKMALGRRKP